MTKRREPNSLEDGVFKAIQHLGDAGVFAATGKSGSFLRQCSDGDDTDHHLQIRHAIALDKACKTIGESPPILAAYCNALDGEDINHQSKAPLERLANAAAVFGEVAGEVSTAVEDGVVHSSERIRIEKAVHKLKTDLDKLLRDIENPKATALRQVS